MNVFVVTATYEFDGIAYGSDLVGVYGSQTRAFAAMEEFDYMKTFERVMIGDVIPGHTSKEFGTYDAGNAFYSEQHYVSTDKEVGASVTITIFEREVE